MSLVFCPECSFLMKPLEDYENQVLNYYCGYCKDYVPSDTPLVYKTTTTDKKQFDLKVIRSALKNDPTLEVDKTAVCSECGNTGAAVIQAPNSETAERLMMIYICKSPACDHKWIDDGNS